MSGFLSSLEVFFEEGFIYAVLAMGAYISYSILDFPDLTAEGTFLSGGVVFALLARVNVNPWLAMLLSFAAGAVGGAITGLMNVKFKIRPILCGLAVGSTLVAFNLVLTVACMGGDLSHEGLSVISVGKSASNIFRALPFSFIPYVRFGVNIRRLFIALIVAVVIKILLDLYFRTRQGILVRSSGRNPAATICASADPSVYKVLGLAISNGLAAVSGAMIVQAHGNANQGMGNGMAVVGLASVMIGMFVFNRIGKLKDTTKVLIGALIFRLCIGVAELLGVPGAGLKLVTALLFFAAVLADRLYVRRRDI